MAPRLLDPRAIVRPRPGYHYEPRVLWGRKTIEQLYDDEMTLQSQNETSFGPDDFTNSNPYPMLVTKMIVMSSPLDAALPPVSAFDPLGGPLAVTDSQDPIAASVDLRIARRGGRPWSLEVSPSRIGWLGSTHGGPLSAWRFQGGTETIWGLDTVAWDFDMPIRVADKGAVQIDLSPFPPWAIGVEEDTVFGSVTSSTVFVEGARQPQRTPGSSRVNRKVQQPMSRGMFEKTRSVMAAEQYVAAYGAELTVDPFSDPAAESLWGNNYGMNARTFSTQQTGYARASMLDRLTISLSRNFEGAQFFGSRERIGNGLNNHLAYGIVTRARTTSGGSGHWWWREGAPLPIVMPNLTPASVFEFRAPFVLDHGDQIDVEAEIGRLYTGIANQFGEGELYFSHAVHVSLVGYACIKD